MIGQHEGSFWCLECAPLAADEFKPPVPDRGLADAEEETEATYLTSISAAVDALLGLSLEDPRPLPANRGVGGQRFDSGAVPSILCDPCGRIVGTGGLNHVGGASDATGKISVEVVCCWCEARYARCTDCGGGGGGMKG